MSKLCVERLLRRLCGVIETAGEARHGEKFFVVIE